MRNKKVKGTTKMIGLIEFARTQGAIDKQKRRGRLETAVGVGGTGLATVGTIGGIRQENKLAQTSRYSDNYGKLSRRVKRLNVLAVVGTGVAAGAAGAKALRMRNERLKARKAPY